MYSGARLRTSKPVPLYACTQLYRLMYVQLYYELCLYNCTVETNCSHLQVKPFTFNAHIKELIVVLTEHKVTFWVIPQLIFWSNLSMNVIIL